MSSWFWIFKIFLKIYPILIIYKIRINLSFSSPFSASISVSFFFFSLEFISPTMAINQLLRSTLRSQVRTQFNRPLFISIFCISRLLIWVLHHFLEFYSLPFSFLLTLYFSFSDRIITIMIVIFVFCVLLWGKNAS